MIRRLPLFLVLLALAGGVSYVAARPQYHSGPDPSKTGAPEVGSIPAESNCSECHYVVDQSNLNAPGGYVQLLDVPATYAAGQTYTMRVRLDSDSTDAWPDRRWGFQVTAYRADNGEGVGTFAISSTDSLQILTGFSFDPWATRNYVEHTAQGLHTGEAGPVEWAFQWQAPAIPAGTVVFAVAGNAANGTFDSDGDWIYTAMDSIRDLTTPTVPVSWGRLKAQFRR